MSALSMLDTIATILVVSSILVGFWNAGTTAGSVSNIIGRAIDEPQTFGVNAVMYYIGLDTWIPTVSPDFLNQHGLEWLAWFYPFAEGHIPHFSIWSCLFGILVATIVTLITHKGKHWSLPKAFLVWFLAFLAGYYVWTLIAWRMMFIGGEAIGLTEAEVHDIWYGSVSATESEPIQLFFLANIPVSFVWLFKRIGRVAF